MKVKVPIYGTAPAKATYVEQGATVGAKIGVNLLLPDGKVGTLAQLQELFGSGTTGDASTGGALNTTDDLDEGQWHLWFTDRRAQDAVGGILTDSANVTLAYSGGASITADLTELTDAGGGTLQRTAFDAYGRKTGTSAATTTDLTEGSNLYFTDERAQDAAGAALDGTGDVPLTYDDAGNKISAALSADVLASLALADSATQPGDLATVATTGAYADLSGLPTLGTAAATDATDYATAVQGALADSAVQPGDLGTAAALDAPASGDAGPTEVVLGNDSRLGGGGGSGDVVGPASAVDGDLALFDGITGKLIKSGGALNKAAVGLGDVDNTSDVNKPVSTAQQTAFDLKGPLTSGVLAYRTTAQSIPSATSTKIAFEATSYDDGGYFSTSTPTRLTVPAAGKYRVSFVVGFAAAAAGNRLAFAQRNNADFPGRPAQRITPSGGLDYLSSTSAVVACAAGDYFELVANQTSSGAINVSSDSATLWFSIERLS